MPHPNSGVSPFDTLSKAELHQLADKLLLEDASGIEECIQFFEADSKGLWHSRARAMMARRLKHCKLSPIQATRVVQSVLGRFLAGDISEQFRDQLRLALLLDARRLFGVALALRSDSRPYVCRFAEWILSHDTETQDPENR